MNVCACLWVLVWPSCIERLACLKQSQSSSLEGIRDNTDKPTLWFLLASTTDSTATRLLDLLDLHVDLENRNKTSSRLLCCRHPAL